MVSFLKSANGSSNFHRHSNHTYRNRSRRLAVETLENRLVLATSYIATDLVSDQPGVAPITDTTLHNAWGVAVGPVTFWVSSEGGGISEVYTGDVVHVRLEPDAPGTGV